MSAQEKDLAGQAAFGKGFFEIGVVLVMSGFAVIGFAPFLFLLGFPLIVLGGIVWIRAKWKARELKGASVPNSSPVVSMLSETVVKVRGKKLQLAKFRDGESLRQLGGKSIAPFFEA